MQTCYIDGDYDAILDMMKFLKIHCRSLGVKKIYGFTCNHKPITRALEKLGFEPSDSTVIFYENSTGLGRDVANKGFSRVLQ